MENLNANDSGMASAASPALIEKSEADKLSELKTAIGGRFNIIESLGSSETYSLFLAHDDVGNLVKLKVLSRIAALDSAKIELFYLEAFAASRLLHPNIARTGEPEYVANVHFCTSEHYPTALSLRSLLDRRGWLEAELAASIASQIAEALGYAHTRNVLHLNLHPENILIGTDGRVIVTGFGIGAGDECDWARLERSRQLPAQYLSPEQAQELQIDHRSDFYSLGILLFEMLTDRVPFDSHDPDAIKRKQIAHAPQSPQVFRSGLSALQAALVMSLLEKSPDKRCSNITQLRSVLNSLAASELVQQDVRASAPREPQIDERREELISPARDPFYEEPLDLPVDRQESAAVEPPPPWQEPARVARHETFEPPTITVIDPPLNALENVNAMRSLRQVSSCKVDAQKPLILEHAGRSSWGWVALILLSAAVAILMSILLARGDHLSRLLRKAPAVETEQAPSASPVSTDTNTPAPAQAEAEKKDSAAQNNASLAGRKQGWRTQPITRSQTFRAKRPVYRSRAVRVNQSSKRKITRSRSLWLKYKRR